MSDEFTEKHVPDEIIVKFKDAEPGQEERLNKIISRVQKIGFTEELGVYIVKIENLERDPDVVMNRLRNNPLVEYVEPNYYMDFTLIPNDKYYSIYQANSLSFINATEGWDINTGEGLPPVTVAIVDSGVAEHPDLPKVNKGFSASSDHYTKDDVGHGTCVAGVLAAVGNNGTGIAGINWNVDLMPIKVDDASGRSPVGNVAKGILWAADNGARVINLSIGSTIDSITFKNSIDYAYNKGCVLVAATGNAGQEVVSYPAKYDNVIGVGATIDGQNRSSTSNFGNGLDVLAVGTMYTTSSSGGHTFMSGTSFATPQVAGLASLMLSLNPTLTNDEIMNLIRQYARRDDGYNTHTGYGIIDMGMTLKAITPLPRPTSITNPTLDENWLVQFMRIIFNAISRMFK